jgi:hypothetical protein
MAPAPWRFDGGPATAPAADSFKLLQLELTQKELIQVQSDLRKTKAELQFWKGREHIFAKLPIPKSALEERIAQDPAVPKLGAKIAEYRDSLAQAENVAKNPAVVAKFRAELSRMEQELDNHKESLRQQITSQLQEKAHDEYRGKLVQLQEQIDLQKELEKVLNTEVLRLVEETRHIRPIEDRLSAIERELRELRAAIGELMKKN